MNNKPLHVIEVITDKNIGGAGRWLLSYLKYFDRKKISIFVIVPEGAQLTNMVRALKVPVFELSEMEEKSFDAKRITAFRALFLKKKPDVVHTHASLTARIAAKLAGVPYIIHSKHYLDNYVKNPWKRKMVVWLNEFFSSQMIAVSSAVRESMLKNGYHPNCIQHIYNGVQAVSPLSEGEKAAVKEKWKLPQDMLLVGIVARLSPIKDHETFLQAVKILAPICKNTKFIIVGDGPLRGPLQERASTLGIMDSVLFLGFVAEVEEIEGVLDVNVITSKEEALCISAIEAMGLGVPTVGTDCGGLTEVITDGADGFIVPIGDANALAEKIKTLLMDDALRRQFQERAQRIVKEKFSAQNMAEKIDALLLACRRR